MQRIAYGFLGLRPDEFWRLTPKEYELMVEGHLESRRAFNAQRAAEVCANVRGQREKRPNLRNIFRSLMREPGRKQKLDPLDEQILRQSRARARRGKGTKGG